MKKKLALMVYPNFSLQEIASICSLFRWSFDTETVVFASDIEAVNAEEGILIQPHKTFDDFSTDDYDCLILSGCSDPGHALRDQRNRKFLEQFKDNHDFIIGAICAGPLFLSQAGLLDDKCFTNSLFVEMNELFTFINRDNLRYEPVVVDRNIVTAVGAAFNEFAVALARMLGYECPDKIFPGLSDDWQEEDFKHHLTAEELMEIKEEFKDFIAS